MKVTSESPVSCKCVDLEPRVRLRRRSVIHIDQRVKSVQLTVLIAAGRLKPQRPHDKDFSFQ